MSRHRLSRREYLDAWADGHGGYDPRGSRLVRTWLGVIHTLAEPLARAHVSPDVITIPGGVLAGVVVWAAHGGGRWVLVAAVLVGLSGLLDSLDGAVAVITERATRWGALLDSLVDRVADACLLVALWVVGAPAWVCLAGWMLLVLLEYSRARAMALDVRDIGTVTVGERPTRMIVVGMFLLAAGVLPGSAATWATTGSYVLVVLGLVALVQLLVVLHRALRAGPDRSP
ncbi:MAG: CDP-alcohol phosphatidyltransferase family protein [Candidatus Nanopelagicales bacterium]